MNGRLHKIGFISILVLSILCTAASAAQKDVDVSIMKSIPESGVIIPDGAVYADLSADPAARAWDVVRRLTFEEKLNLCGGWNRFLFPGVERLGLRPVSMADASQGLRTQTAVITDSSTSFPSMQAMASTWNEELANIFGKNIGEECRAFGVDLLLGPGINMQRHSEGGRNFEYMGEDPLLTGRMASAYISGLQSQGIIAVPKHFVCNDQEFCRHIASSEVDERTLREIYLLPWEMAFTKAGSLGFMTGNNLLNGLHNALNRPVLQDILRDEYGFMGIAMTDWQNTGYFPKLQHLFLTSGHSLLMPDNNAFRKYVDSCRSDETRMQEIEVFLEKIVFQNLYPIFLQGIYDRPFNIPAYFDKRPAHADFAAQCGSEAIILLKNEAKILPVAKGKKILMMGSEEFHSGKGSGFVDGYDHCDYATGLKEAYGDAFTCIEAPTDRQIREADVVIFRLNKTCGEGNDVPFDEPADQLKELRRVSKICRNLIVIVTAANPMPTDWVPSVKGILWTGYLGQARGKAMAAVISGKTSPSGKLPFTVECDFAQSPDPDFNYIGGVPYWKGNNQYKGYWIGYDKKAIPGFSDYVKPGEPVHIYYDEGVFMGYRWWDKTGGKIRFPFGYGLSYTTFRYNSIDVNPCADGSVRVRVKVSNTGAVDAKEIVELYVSDPMCSVERPEKELKDFRKVLIPAGESVDVEFSLDRRAFSYWDSANHEWSVEPGEFVISVGPNSSELVLKSTVEL